MKTHSEIKDFLSKVGIKANLTLPPRESIAVLSDSVSAFACSARFRSPFSGCGMTAATVWLGNQNAARLMIEAVAAWVCRSINSTSHRNAPPAAKKLGIWEEKSNTAWSTQPETKPQARKKSKAPGMKM